MTNGPNCNVITVWVRFNVCKFSSYSHSDNASCKYEILIISSACNYVKNVEIWFCCFTIAAMPHDEEGWHKIKSIDDNYCVNKSNIFIFVFRSCCDIDWTWLYWWLLVWSFRFCRCRSVDIGSFYIYYRYDKSIKRIWLIMRCMNISFNRTCLCDTQRFSIHVHGFIFTWNLF